ncbi:hypothetical protein [Hymenobacter sp. 102]|uniref:hypothetical protein n=1 Tax=Hymenobacter sp. 102 TaxID=3403152 RepID=UPI003CF03843
MILRFSLFLFFTLSWVSLSSCGSSEKEAELILTGDYQSQSFAQLEDLQLYSSAGQITDPAVITNFLNHDIGINIRQKYGDGFVQGKNTEELKGLFSISFREEKKATVTLPFQSSSSNPIETQITEKNNKLIILTGLDSITRITSVESSDSYGSNINLYNSQGKCRPISTSGGYSIICKAPPVFPIHHNSGELSLPLFSYFLRNSRNGTTSFSWGSNIFGVFNRSILSKMLLGDTLVIQSKKVALDKR